MLVDVPGKVLPVAVGESSYQVLDDWFCPACTMTEPLERSARACMYAGPDPDAARADQVPASIWRGSRSSSLVQRALLAIGERRAALEEPRDLRPNAKKLSDFMV